MVGLVLLDVLIIAAAVWLSRPRVEEATARSVELGASSPADASEGSDVSAPLFLAGGPDGRLVRATRGACEPRATEQARVWVGPAEDLAPVEVPGLVEVLGVVWSGGTLSLTGADADCELRGWTSQDRGASWAQGRVDRSVWRLDLDRTASVVHGPGGGPPEEIACVPSGVQGAGARAVVVCRDSVASVGSSPQDAQQVFSAPLVGAALADGPSAMLVLTTTDGCATLGRARTDGSIQRLACIARDAAALGVARSGDRLFVQAGRDLYASSDGRDFELVPAAGA